ARFLDQAVAGLAGADGRVVPVRLSLFAEVVRRRPWTPATLRALGGVEGVGGTFLEEAFDSTSAPPSYRLPRRAAPGGLQAFLPAPTSDLKGVLRSGRELVAASGYADRPGDFKELMRVLDSELRMVSAADPVGAADGGSAPVASGETYYQLAHDYLVASV